MRKYGLLLLGFLLDVALAGTLVKLAAPFAERVLDIPLPAIWQVFIVLALVLAAAMLDSSPGSWLLAPATVEREAGVTARQWPNLVLGTLGILGVASAAIDPAKTLAAPFLLMVEPTPLKLAVVALYHATLGWGGIMLLRFMAGARLVNLILFVFGVIVGIVNYLFSRDAMVAMIQASGRDRGAPPSLEDAERYVSYGALYGIGLGVIMLAVLWLCRERPRQQ